MLKKYTITLSKIMFIAFIATSCIKTAEEIQREQMVDEMKMQMDQSAQLIADLTQRMSSLQEKSAMTEGQLQEIDHNQKSGQENQKAGLEQNLALLTEQVNALAIKVDQNQKNLSEMQRKLNEQSDYIQKVNATLTGVAGKKKSGQSLEKSNGLKEAHRLFEKGENTKAQDAYTSLLGDKSLTKRQMNEIYHNLGLLNYWNKKYDDALVFFSKIYANTPKSSLAPNALLHIAHSFNKQGKPEEANATYQEVINKYPNSKQAKIAQKEIK